MPRNPAESLTKSRRLAAGVIVFPAVAQEAEQLIAGKYRLERRLAGGGMGSVWVARHTLLDVNVAIKFRKNPEGLDPKGELRFRREAQAAAHIKSPHVVQIHDYGVDAGTPYIVMELLEGEDLAACLEREGRLSPDRALSLVAQAAKALELAHHAGIVHRDIKPSNLFLARQGRDEVLKVLDFGIAMDTRDGGSESTTSVGVVLGSPSYMSPEQARGRRVDGRSDVYSLAAVLYRMLTGVAPVTGDNPQDIMIKICSEPLIPPSRRASDLPPGLDSFFARALCHAPEGRFQSVEELVRGFETIAGRAGERPPRAGDDAAPIAARNERPLGRDDPTESLFAARPPVERSPQRWLALGAGAVCVAGAAYWAFGGDGQPPPPSPRSEPTTTQAPPSIEPASLETVESAPLADRPSANDPPEPTAAVQGRPAPARSPQPATVHSGALAPPPSPPSAETKPPQVPPSPPPKLDPVFGLPLSSSPAKEPPP